MTRFNFVGVVGFNAIDSKMPPIRTGKTKKGANYKTLNMYLTLPNKNRVNMELFGMESDTIKTKDTEGNDVEFDWANRTDEEIVKSVAFYRKNVLSLGDDQRFEFVTPLDMIDKIWSMADQLRGKVVTATGTVERSYYKGEYKDRFKLQNVYIAAEDAKQSFKTTLEFFWNKEGIDTNSYAEEKRIYFDGYTLEYDSDLKENRYMPRQVILDLSKIDWENPKHAAIAKFNLSTMGLSYENGKLKVTLGKGYYSNRLICSYSNGAKEVEFDESQLTDFQKMQIELGLATVDDFRPRNGIRGEFVTEYKLVKFDSTGDYSEGTVKLDMSDDDFEELIYVPAVSEGTLEEETTKEEVKNVEVDDDDDDLFD